MLPFFVILPMVIAVFLFLTKNNNVVMLLSVVFQFVLFVLAVWLVMETRDVDVFFNIGDYEDMMGIILRANSLSAVFVLLTTFVFLVISVFTYKDNREQRTFRFLLFVLESSLLGIFLTGDLFNIFVLVEVSTLAIVVLTMYDRERRNMYHGKVFLLANMVAIQFYLLGLGYLYRLTGSPDMGRVTELVAVMDYRNFILPYVLIMTSIAFKCYLIPFFSWVPKAQLYPGAPSGVAAILSGLQIKSSIYLFIRFQEIFAPIAAAEFFLVIGIIMGVFGALMAISQSDIKSILAYSTISQVGLIIIGINAGSEYSYIGSLYHIVSHAIFKTTLFLFASIVVRTYRTADVNKIRSVAKRMPAVSIAAAAAVLGIIGAPLFNGSISKYFITYDMGIVLNIIVVLLGFGTILYYSRFIKIFFGKGDIAAEKLEKVWVVPVCFLGIICFVGGIFGTVLINFLFREQVSINVLGYLQKSAYFAVSAIVGFIVHRYFIKSGVIFERLRGMSFNFKTICASLLVFFVCMLLYVGWLL